jgi:hypothetical protein
LVAFKATVILDLPIILSRLELPEAPCAPGPERPQYFRAHERANQGQYHTIEDLKKTRQPQNKP